MKINWQKCWDTVKKDGKLGAQIGAIIGGVLCVVYAPQIAILLFTALLGGVVPAMAYLTGIALTCALRIAFTTVAGLCMGSALGGVKACHSYLSHDEDYIAKDVPPPPPSYTASLTPANQQTVSRSTQQGVSP